MMKRQAKKTKVMAIVHGKSELLICSSIKSNLKIKHEIIARDKGKSSIQVNGILDILNDRRFESFNAFIKFFPDIEYRKKELLNFKLFIILDIDDCCDDIKRRYINKEIFAKHWLYKYIVSIYNDPNLEMTMKQIDIPVIRKKDYIVVFPTNHGDLDVKIAEKFCNDLKKCNCTNMYEYVEYCLSII